MQFRYITFVALISILISCQSGQSPNTTTPATSSAVASIPGSSEWNSIKYALELDFGLPTGFKQNEANDPQKLDLRTWDATTLVQKIVSSGFQSLTFPVKMVDGFTLYNNAHSEFNSTKKLSPGKDMLKEISDACKTSGIQLGISYSLVDWSHTGESWSDHYADRIPEQLMPKILTELQELLTQYGPIHHIQFKHGSLSEAQSDSIYQKVRSIQPDCMINGLRTANNDFSLISNEHYEDYQFNVPWRCTARLNYTSSSKSEEEARGILHRLLQIISKGGQFALKVRINQNGQLDEKHIEVLEAVAQWLSDKKEFVYETEESAFGIRSWGAVTKAQAKSKLYLYILNWPEDNIINLYGLNNTIFGLFSSHQLGTFIPYEQKGRNLVINIGGDVEQRLGTGILVLEYTGILDITPLKMAYARAGSWTLLPKNAVIAKTVDQHNHYAMAPVDHQYIWNLPPTSGGAYAIKCKYTRQEIGRELILQVGANSYDLVLDNAQQEERPEPQEIIYGLFYQGNPSLQNQNFTKRHGPTKGFSRGERWGFDGEVEWIEREDWKQGESWSINAPPMSSTYIYQSMYSQADQTMVSAFTGDDGISVWSDGNLIAEVMKFDEREQTLIEIPLTSGNNQLMYRFFNNHDDHNIAIQHDVLAAQYVKPLESTIQLEANTITEIKLYRKDQSTLPLYLTNFSIEIAPVQQM